ncbi:MAG: hypothetical protein PUJ47_01060 [Clostridia bacterium]|nr:hypothetical protein [Clostridia bacterium]
MSISSRIRKNIASKLLGKEYIILRSEEYNRIRTEFEQKISELEKRLESVLIDEAEYRFLKHFSTTLVTLEKRLHDSDNADEILKATYQTACEFYEADWAGFLELDMEAGLWWPFDWFSVKNNDMTKTYLNDFEPTAIVPRWIAAMKNNEAIVVKDREDIRELCTKEYALYERVKLHSVMAVPVKPRPCGFMAIRNPQRYVDAAYADMLQLLAFVALVNINDKMAKRMIQTVNMPKDIHSENDIYIKLFGNFELRTAHGTLRTENTDRSTAALLLSYLALRIDKATSSVRLARIFYPGESDSINKVYNIVSSARNDLKSVQVKDLLPPADAEGYHFNSRYHVITDLSRFDELFDDIINNSSSYRTYMNCVQIFEMYTDDIWLDIPDSEVELQRLYYHQKYFTVLNKLLNILYDSGDYDGVRKVAEKGLQIEPGHTEMYRWLYSVYKKMNLSKSAKDIMKIAMKCMSEEEYADFLKQIDNNE